MIELPENAPCVGFLGSGEFAQGVNFPTRLYVGSTVELAASVAHSGLNSMMGKRLISVLSLGTAAPCAASRRWWAWRPAA